MKLEEQVCGLESAKRLKELGVKQESLFWHVPIWGAEEISYYEILPHRLYAKPDKEYSPDYSAFTVAELGELLPASIGEGNWLQWTKSLNGWGGCVESVAYVKWHNDCQNNKLWLEDVHKISNAAYDKITPKTHTEAEARAKMLIYLLENKLLEQK